MGLRWRKVLVGGPARLNLSLRGIGTSIGIPGLRFGISASGRRYVAVGIPGTGLYYWHYFGRAKNQTVQSENECSMPAAGGWWNDAKIGGDRR